MSLPARFIVVFALLAPLATGCGDKEGCTKLAQHLTDVVEQERGKELGAELREKMINKTIDSCLAEPPGPEALQCALKASSSEAMKKCDPQVVE